MQTITRKFLVKQLPTLNQQKRIAEQRYYLYRKNGIVIRIQSKGDHYELERKINKSDLLRESERISITKAEFEALRQGLTDTIVRDNYVIPGNPPITLRVYQDRFEGLIRAEIQFSSTEDAQQFVPQPWLDREITGTVLGNDETLLNLPTEEFLKLLQ